MGGAVRLSLSVARLGAQGDAVTTTYATAPGFNIGRAVGRTFSALWKNLATFGLTTLLAVVAFGVIFVVVNVVVAAIAITAKVDTASQGSAWSFALANAVLLPLQLGFITSMLVDGGVTAMSGGKPKFGAMLAAGARNMLPVGGLLVLMAAAIWIAWLFFVVPGVILTLCWAAVVPAQVIEKKGFGAFGRSFDLTRNQRGAIFGFSLLMGIINIGVMVIGWVLFGAVTFAFGMAGNNTEALNDTAAGGFFLSVCVLYLVFYTLFLLLACLAPAAVYVELTTGRGETAADVFG